jgi:hypothetical protein
MVRNFVTFEEGMVDWAGLAVGRPFFGGKKNRSSEAQKAGIRYERRAQEYLTELFPDQYVASPWVAFRLKGEPLIRWCQPDGLIVDIERSRVTVVEIKLRHCIEAYIQLNGIYLPVIRRIFPLPWELRQIEVTRYYDAMTAFPVKAQLVSSVDLVPKHQFGVHIFR